MSPWHIKLHTSSSPEDFAYWESLRTLGRGYYVRTCTLFWASAAIGAGCFADLVYHFARFGLWHIGTLWSCIALAALCASVIAYSRRWRLNEQFFNARRDTTAANPEQA